MKFEQGYIHLKDELQALDKGRNQAKPLDISKESFIKHFRLIDDVFEFHYYCTLRVPFGMNRFPTLPGS